MKRNLGSVCLALALLSFNVPGFLYAQDEAATEKPAKAPAAKPAKNQGTMDFLPTAAESRAEEDRQRAIRKDHELRSRLENTVWNDLDLRAGQPGQVWMFEPPQQQGKGEVRDWYLNDGIKLPRVGSWQVKNQEILLYAQNSTLIGRAKYVEDEISGRFIDPDRKKEFGKFRLREETKRNYRVLPMRVIKPTLGK